MTVLTQPVGQRANVWMAYSSPSVSVLSTSLDHSVRKVGVSFLIWHANNCHIILLKGYECLPCKKGHTICHTEKAILFVMQDSPRFLSHRKGHTICHAGQPTLFVTQKGSHYLSCRTTHTICHTERAIPFVM